MDSIFRSNLYAQKHVVITGGSSGIGLAIAKAFADHGARLTIIGRSQERLDAAMADIAGEAAGISLDVRDHEGIAKMAAELGPVDVLINAAAGNFPVPFDAMSHGAWKSVIDIVLNGTANMCHALRPNLVEGASVINIVAGYAWTGAPAVSHSGAAKAGVLNLTKSLAVEWAPDIRVNAISPGPIAGTEGMKRLGTDLGLDQLLMQAIPAARFGEGTEIASAALWLASPGASYTTGACLPIDGGQDALGPFGGLWQAMKN